MPTIRTHQKRIHGQFSASSETLKDLTDFMPLTLNREGKGPGLARVKLYIYLLLDIVQLVFVDRTQRFFSFHFSGLCSCQSEQASPDTSIRCHTDCRFPLPAYGTISLPPGKSCAADYRNSRCWSLWDTGASAQSEWYRIYTDQRFPHKIRGSKNYA